MTGSYRVAQLQYDLDFTEFEEATLEASFSSKPFSRWPVYVNKIVTCLTLFC